MLVTIIYDCGELSAEAEGNATVESLYPGGMMVLCERKYLAYPGPAVLVGFDPNTGSIRLLESSGCKVAIRHRDVPDGDFTTLQLN